MSLGCYIISKKKILINKEAVKDKSRYVSPEKLIINEDSIFIYGDEDENQLIEKILSVKGVHRYGVFSLIFGTLNVYYENRVENTLNKLKKVDINTYNEVKQLLYTDKKNTEIPKTINNPLKNKFCVNCGTEIISKNRFCTNCGSEIFSSNSPIIKSKSAQEWIIKLIQKHKHKNMMFSLSFNNDNIIVYGDLCPDVPSVRRTWEWIVPFKSIKSVDLKQSQNPLYFHFTISAKLFKSFKKINLNEANNLNPKSVFKNMKFIKESKVKEVEIVISNSITNDAFNIKQLKYIFNLAIS